MKAYLIRDLSFKYNEQPVLTELSFDIEPAEFFGIIGPNGAGKSTLLKILDHIIGADAGRIEIFGKPINSYSQKELARVVAYVPQETHFGLDFKVRDVLLMGRYPYQPFLSLGIVKDPEPFEQILLSTNLSGFKDRLINSLSSGERQRVIIARALVQRPKILLLDEPTSHLDLKYQLEIMELLKQLNREGLTIIFVSHDLNLASLYCSRLMLLNQGKIEAIDTPERIISRDWLARIYDATPEIINHPRKQKPQILLPG
ncbi:MAG: ABC transporter ATP-binding protein [candidate division WOR-3 bacterium]